jgi:hypothetical protein
MGARRKAWWLRTNLRSVTQLVPFSMDELSTLSPHEWLEHHRRANGYSSVSAAGDPRRVQTLQRRFKESAQRIIEKYGHLNQYQFDDFFIERLLLTIRIAEEERQKTGDVYFGVFPTFDFRGRLTHTPRGDKIILLHSGLISTIQAWAMFFILRTQGNDFEKFMNNTTAAADFFAAVGKLWKPELRYARIDDPYPFELDEESWLLTTALIDSSLAFILGHELGHLIERHPGYTGDAALDYKMEYEADAWGLKFCVRHIVLNGPLFPKFVSRTMCLGPYLALGVTSVIQDIPGRHHPSASMRLERITKNLRRTFLEVLGRDGLEMYHKEVGGEFFRRAKSMGTRLFGMHKRCAMVIDSLAKEVAKVQGHKKPTN